MTDSIAVHPPTKRLSGRLVALITAIAFGVAAIAAVVLLALAVNDTAEPAQEPGPAVETEVAPAQLFPELCEPVSRQQTRC